MLERPVSKAGWTRVAFGDVVRKVNDRVDPWDSGLERYVAGEHMDTDDLRIRRWGQIGDDYLGPAFHMRFKPGHVLYGSRRTYLRKVALADFEGITANTTFVLETKDPARLMPELLPLLMQTEAFHSYSIKHSKGSVNPYINFTDLEAFEFLLPPIQEQARQLSLMLAFDDAIIAAESSREAALVVWRAMSKEEFSSRAGSGSRLADHYSIASGQVDPKADKFRDLPLVGPNHIESVTGIFLGTETAQEQSAISGKYLFEPGSLLYSKIRPELRKAMLPNFRGLCSADIYPLVSGPTIVPEYLLDLVLSDAFSAFAISCSMRTGMPKMNREQLEQFLFDLPTVEHQMSYVAAATGVKKIVGECAARSTRLFVMKKIILNRVSSDVV